MPSGDKKGHVFIDINKISRLFLYNMPIPIATLCKARVYDRSFAGITVLNPTRRKDICPFESVLYVVR
jgi:hypothetical protein